MSFIDILSAFRNEDKDCESNNEVIKGEKDSTWRILIVGQDLDLHRKVEERLEDFSFEEKNITFLNSPSIKEGKSLFNEYNNIGVAIIDLQNIGKKRGLELVDYIRNKAKDKLVQIIIIGDDFNQKVKEEIIEKYEINDYNNNIQTFLEDIYNLLTIYLRSYNSLKELKESVSIKKNIEDELKVANKIQDSMLPGNDAPLPKGEEFEIYASMESAREVGGDFYDAFLLSKNKLCFFIGDVSGKGIPAALFMAITKTLIKNEVLKGLAIEDVFYNVNNTLCKGNKEQFFATASLGILDLDMGSIDFVNAGHNAPILYRPMAEGGCGVMRPTKNIVLGALDYFKYELDTFNVVGGDILILYTDGVVEARDEEQAQYSRRRLEEIVCKVSHKGVGDIERKIKEDIESFINKEPQSDDLTMIILKYKGRASYYVDDFIL